MASTPSETTTKTEPWDGAKPYILKYLQQADDLYSNGNPEYFPGQTYVDPSKSTVDARNMVEQTARQGTNLFGNAQNAANGVMNGSAYSGQANQTLSNLQNGISLGTTGAGQMMTGGGDPMPTQLGAGQMMTGGGDPMPMQHSGGDPMMTAGGGNMMMTGGPDPMPTQAGQQTAMPNANPAVAGVNPNYTNPANAQAANGNTYANAALGGQEALAGQLAGANNPAMSMLQQTANGDFLNSNPHLNQAIANANAPLVEQFKNQIAPGLDSRAALAGRTGSGAHAAVRNDAESTIANAMSKNASDIMYQNYGQERTNQLNAQNQIGALYNSDIANQSNALANLANTSNSQQSQRLAGTELFGNLNNQQEQLRQSASSLQNQFRNSDFNNALNNANLQLNAANSQFANENAKANTQLQAAGMSEYLRNLDYADANRLAGVGAQDDAFNNLKLQSEIARWDYQQNQPFNNIANMLNMANGGGYNNQTTPVHSNTGAQALGGIASILGLFLSDGRKKQILQRVGETPNGIPMYQFVYNDDPARRIYVGPIAQEMAQIKPGSVFDIEGTLFVDSDALTEEPTWH